MDWQISQVASRVRLLAFVALFATFAVVMTPATATAAVDESSPAGRAADWIAREYKAPDSEIKMFGTGILIDSLVSLAATGTESGTALDMLEDLRGQAATYVGTGSTFNVGAAGKVIHVLEVYGEDVASFTGADIEAELRSAIQTTGPDTGRFAEASVWNQSLAVLALSMTDDGVPAAAVEWLANAQCPSGEFTYDGTCTGSTDADTTGIATLALIAAGDTATADVSVAWLVSLQMPDGSIPGYGISNSNSTAAAAMAFVAAGETPAADSAAGYLSSMQFAESAGEADAGGLKWIASDTTANTFATVQGVWGMGVPALYEIEAPGYGFSDTTGTAFGTEIEWIAVSGITLGCNPPVNDGFCPNDPVTRGQMAAFLNRALELPAGTGQTFSDTAGNVFLADIEAIVAAGITKGCNPPVNDQYCPDALVTREQMAAFVARAFDLAPGGDSGFVDIADSIFAADIEAIAAAGVTKGCNPPDNNEFCPSDFVTREQMAAFIYRAMH